MLPVAKAFRHMIATKGPSLHDDSSSLPFPSSPPTTHNHPLSTPVLSANTLNHATHTWHGALA